MENWNICLKKLEIAEISNPKEYEEGGAEADSHEIKALYFVYRHSGGEEIWMIFFCSASNPDVVFQPSREEQGQWRENWEILKSHSCLFIIYLL